MVKAYNPYNSCDICHFNLLEALPFHLNSGYKLSHQSNRARQYKVGSETTDHNFQTCQDSGVSFKINLQIKPNVSYQLKDGPVSFQKKKKMVRLNKWWNALVKVSILLVRLLFYLFYLFFKKSVTFTIFLNSRITFI